MAIQMRRGAWSQFDPTKMLPGEWAVILSGHPDTSNGQALYHCFAAGSVKQIATIDDAATIIANATEDIRDELTQDIASALAQVGAATNSANTATANANTATSAANAATQAATSASERAEDAIAAMGDISEQAVPEMSADVRGGAKLEEHGGLALRDGALGIGSLAQQSDGYARGGLAEVTAKGHAEQVATTGKNLCPRFSDNTINGVKLTTDLYGRVVLNGTSTSSGVFQVTLAEAVSGPCTVSCTASNAPEGDSYYISVFLNAAWNSLGKTGNTISSGTITRVALVVGSGFTFSNATFELQLELGSTATAYEPYTGGAPSPSPDYPQEIQVVRGRNLFSISEYTTNASGYTQKLMTFPELSEGQTFIVHGQSTDGVAITNANCSIVWYNTETLTQIWNITPNSAWTVDYSHHDIRDASGFYVYTNSLLAGKTLQVQLELGSTVHPYVPYGHVGLDVTADGTTTTTPIPLPQRGWVAGLPDGTADSLRLDGAGKCEWELADAETTTAATDGVTGTIGADVLSTTGQIADGATVLYKLATPVTEDCGYVDMPEISGECQVSIPELDEVGIKYFVDNSVTELAKQWYERANSEYEDRLASLEAAVSEIIAG